VATTSFKKGSASFDKSGAFGSEIVITGLDAVLSGLEEVDMKLRKQLEKDMRETVKTVAQAASRQVRSRTGATAAGYKVQMRAGSYKVRNRTRGAAILEFAAIPKCPQGQHLVSTLNEEYGKPGRILWDSWDVMEPWVTGRLQKLMEDAEFELERSMS
jgi:hypothetical protein